MLSVPFLPKLQLMLGTSCDLTNSRHFLLWKLGSFKGIKIGEQASISVLHPSIPHSISSVSPYPENTKYTCTVHRVQSNTLIITVPKGLNFRRLHPGLEHRIC